MYFLTDISSTSETFLMHEGVHEDELEIDHKRQFSAVFLLFVAVAICAYITVLVMKSSLRFTQR